MYLYVYDEYACLYVYAYVVYMSVVLYSTLLLSFLLMCSNIITVTWTS